MKKKIINKTQLFFEYIRLRIRSKIAAERKIVFVEMMKIIPNRRLFHLCQLLIEAGYCCHINMPLKNYIRLDKYGKRILQSPYVRIATVSSKKKSDLLITDSNFSTTESAKCLTIRYDVFAENIPESALFFPMHFHPNFQSKQKEEEVLNWSKQSKKRKISVFFAGNVNPNGYDREITRKFFKINTRSESYKYLVTQDFESEVIVIKTFDELLEKMNAGILRDKVVLMNTFYSDIPEDRWFDVLNECDFFIHLPGYIQPYCHNQVESMASGAIPITQFPAIFLPTLQNGFNALVYSSLDDLKELLNMIISKKITPEQILVMRSALLSTYLNHFSFKTFTKLLHKYVKSDELNKDIYICAGEDSMVGNTGRSLR